MITFDNQHLYEEYQTDRIICGQLPKYELPPVTFDPIRYFTDMELSNSAGGQLIYDIEVFENYFLAAFMCYDTGRVATFELTEERKPDFGKLKWLVDNFTIIGFNNKNFDCPMLWGMMGGLWNGQLHQLAHKLIKQKRYSAYKAEREWGFKIGFTNEIDLLEVAPSGRYTSLKQYNARMHVKWLQDLPFDPNKKLTPCERFQIENYCVNGDCVGTAHLYSWLQEPINLRNEMGCGFGIDLRSKSDAQVSEAVIGSEIEAATGHFPSRPKKRSGEVFHYQMPDWMEFDSPELQQLQTEVWGHEFVIENTGYVEKWHKVVNVGGWDYKIGIGGIHSQEKSITRVADVEALIIDYDVATYYLSLIHISEPTRQAEISYAVFCLQKKT